MSRKQKIMVVILCIWSFIHTFLFLKNIVNIVEGVYTYKRETPMGTLSLSYPLTSGFYPFTGHLAYYDLTEYFLYVGGVWMLFFLYRFLKKK